MEPSNPQDRIEREFASTGKPSATAAIETTITAHPAAWSQGNFQRIASAHVLVGELLCRAGNVRPGEQVLDVASGTGNAALAAARRGAQVIATDIVGPMLEVARKRAAAEELTIVTEVADAQALPFADASFDVVLSTFGVMFAADQRKAARELLRVCRPGGRICLANWTPGGLVGRSLAVMRTWQPAQAQAAVSTDWGKPSHLRELFGEGIRELRIEMRTSDLCAPSPHTVVALQREHLPPVRALFASLESEHERTELAADFVASLDTYNRALDGTFIAAADYLEVVAVRA